MRGDMESERAMFKLQLLGAGVRRLSAVAKAKTWLWEEFGEALEKDLQLASRKAGFGSGFVQHRRRTADPDQGYCPTVEKGTLEASSVKEAEFEDY